MPPISQPPKGLRPEVPIMPAEIVDACVSSSFRPPTSFQIYRDLFRISWPPFPSHPILSSLYLACPGRSFVLNRLLIQVYARTSHVARTPSVCRRSGTREVQNGTNGLPRRTSLIASRTPSCLLGFSRTGPFGIPFAVVGYDDVPLLWAWFPRLRR